MQTTPQQPPAPAEMLALQARAITLAQRVIDDVEPGQMGAPTPCTEWDVRALLNHMVGLNRMVAALAVGGDPPDRGADLLGDDPKAAFADSARAADAALREEGALGRPFRMPFGEVPGAVVAGMRAVDLLVHTWDLAKATGQPTALDPDFCQTALAMAQAHRGAGPRRPGSPFGPAVEIPDDVPVCDRFAAYLGRQP